MESLAPLPTDSEHRRILDKSLGRVGTILKHSSSTHIKEAPTSTAPAATEVSDKEHRVRSVIQPAEPLKTAQALVLDKPETMAASIESDIIEPDTHRYDRTSVLSAKYNIGYVQPQRPTPSRTHVERVSRPVRMRIRYTCHRCKTAFGHDKDCLTCQHRRCTRCDRYPPKRTAEQKARRTAAAAAAAETAVVIEVAEQPDADKACICHECQTDIYIGVEECPNCHHAICDKCLQEVAETSERQRPVSAIARSRTQYITTDEPPESGMTGTKS